MGEFVTFVVRPLLQQLLDGNIKVVTNAGGLNPQGLKLEIERVAAEMGLHVKVAAVFGDDLLNRAGALTDNFHKFGHLDDREPLPHEHSDNLISLNAYVGAEPIARVSDAGAQIVVTGRCVDSAIVLGPLMHEYAWRLTDYDLLAAGTFFIS